MRVTAAVGVALLLGAASPVGGGQIPSGHEAIVFTADLRGTHVAPEAVNTAASARATGVLVGDRFTVHGSFTALSSALRDIENTPDDPGIHLHRGAPGETTPYFHGLQAELNADQRSGIFFGTTTLNDEQRARLLAGTVYVDIHTVAHGPGELRDQWRPADDTAGALLVGEPTIARRLPLTSTACH